MEKIKRIISCFTALLLAFSLCACQYTPPVDDDNNGGNNNDNNSGGGNEDGQDPDKDDPTPEGDPFTVTLVYDGDFFKPKYDPALNGEDVIYAQWSDGYNLYTAPVGDNGKASITGLDGDYQVTLSHLPEGYTYNPNIYFSTNDSKNLIIDVYKLVKTRGSGTGLYGSAIIEITKTGVYRAKLSGEDKIVYYEYCPKKEGTYTVESWINVTDNQYNPKVDIYTGTFAAKYFKETLDNGGVEMGYTKNFLFKVDVTADMIGNVYSFGIKVDSKNGIYPAYVDFSIQRNGSFEGPERNKTMKIPEELGLQLLDGTKRADFIADYILSEYGITKESFVEDYLSSHNGATAEDAVEAFGVYEQEGETAFINAYRAEHTYMNKVWAYPEVFVNGNRQLDSSLWGLNTDSGYYQMYNEETGKYDGPILYAMITEPCRYLGSAINVIEDLGSAYLTVANGKENYKLFIEGYASLEECLYDLDGEFEYTNYEGIEGYADYANADGAVPVTQELKEFLQKLSISQLYFRDGNGWCETHEAYPTDSTEADQWLFACVYYR